MKTIDILKELLESMNAFNVRFPIQPTEEQGSSEEYKRYCNALTVAEDRVKFGEES